MSRAWAQGVTSSGRGLQGVGGSRARSAGCGGMPGPAQCPQQSAVPCTGQQVGFWHRPKPKERHKIMLCCCEGFSAFGYVMLAKRQSSAKGCPFWRMLSKPASLLCYHASIGMRTGSSCSLVARLAIGPLLQYMIQTPARQLKQWRPQLKHALDARPMVLHALCCQLQHHVGCAIFCMIRGQMVQHALDQSTVSPCRTLPTAASCHGALHISSCLDIER